ncbi:MAG: nucleotidyltransferase family protein [Candidatus Omnitrophica bacterium]|nr:nucleotidyltransferase family protein [Candidatus Omnitrophota bacterium]
METLNETLFLYQISEFLYKKTRLKRIIPSQIDLQVFFAISMKNNMLYYHCEKLLRVYRQYLNENSIIEIDNIINKLERQIGKIKTTIIFLKNCLKDFLLIKTYRGYPRIPNDIDILATDFRNALNVFKKEGFEAKDVSFRYESAQLFRENYYKVHLHGKIHWANSEFFDRDFIMAQPRDIEFLGIKAKVPSFDADFLMHVAHINFESLHITLSDLFYLYSISKEINWEKQLFQVKKYNWKRAFINTLKIMDGLYHRLYSDVCPFTYFDFGHKALKSDFDLIMPKTLPRLYLLNNLFEKRLFLYALLKLPKSLKILSRGDAYTDFYRPAEDIARAKLT